MMEEMLLPRIEGLIDAGFLFLEELLERIGDPNRAELWKRDRRDLHAALDNVARLTAEAAQLERENFELRQENEHLSGRLLGLQLSMSAYGRKSL